MNKNIKMAKGKNKEEWSTLSSERELFGVKRYHSKINVKSKCHSAISSTVVYFLCCIIKNMILVM